MSFGGDEQEEVEAGFCQTQGYLSDKCLTEESDSSDVESRMEHSYGGESQNSRGNVSEQRLGLDFVNTPRYGAQFINFSTRELYKH